MKLIRLTTTDNFSNFDNDFSSDINIMENSKICLHSLSFQPIQNVIVIDGTNDTIDYNLTNSTPANTKTITLEQAVYTNINFQDFLDDMETKFNNSLTLTGKQIGAQFQCFVGVKTKKAEIGYKFSPIKNDDFFTNLGITTGTAFIKKDNNVDTRFDGSRLTSDSPFIKGAGVLRVRISSLGDNGSGNKEDNGFTIGLTETEPSKITGNAIIVKYGIKVGRNTDDYQSIQNDSFQTHLGISPENFNDATLTQNDVLELSVSEGKIRALVYRESQATADILFEETLDRTKNLYPFLSFQGGNLSTKANILRYNYDPTLYSINNKETQKNNIVDIHTGFTVSPPAVPRNSSTILRVNFPLSISEFLGFKQEIQIKSGIEVNLIGDILFTATLINDSFLVEMKNIELESYDGFGLNGTRRNILAIVPKSDESTGIIEYEPNNPYFIDMNNTQKSFRNIRARLLRSDLEPVQISGLAILTILIKCPNE